MELKTIFQIIISLNLVILSLQEVKIVNMRMKLESIPSAVVSKMFTRWKKIFNITYPNYLEELKGYINFQTDYRKTVQHNTDFLQGDYSYTRGVNQKSGMTNIEKYIKSHGFKIDSQYHSSVLGKVKLSDEQEIFPPAPKSLDYRTLGYLTEVVDQGYDCSSCYAFSAIATIEAARFKKYGVLEKLSEQNIIDCNYHPILGNFGCNGGVMPKVYDYVIGNPGVEAASTYPLQKLRYNCRFNSSNAAGFLTSHKMFNGDEEYLKRVLAATGPIAIGINAFIDSFYSYSSGIYNDEECSDDVINHAVVLVGYGTDKSFNPTKDFWIIRNSWGKYWGEGGYMRLERGTNRCGVTNYTVYPIV